MAINNTKIKKHEQEAKNKQSFSHADLPTDTTTTDVVMGIPKTNVPSTDIDTQFTNTDIDTQFTNTDIDTQSTNTDIDTLLVPKTNTYGVGIGVPSQVQPQQHVVSLETRVRNLLIAMPLVVFCCYKIYGLYTKKNK